MELEKAALEEAFKRTIKVREHKTDSSNLETNLKYHIRIAVTRRGEGDAGRPGGGPHQQALRLGEESQTAEGEEALQEGKAVRSHGRRRRRGRLGDGRRLWSGCRRVGDIEPEHGRAVKMKMRGSSSRNLVAML